MRLLLQMPPDRHLERGYAVDVVLGEFLGQEVAVRLEERQDWRLTDTAGRAALTLPDAFFAAAQAAWLQPPSLPDLPLPRWRPATALPEAAVVEDEVPVLAGTPLPPAGWWRQEGNEARLGLDIFGSAFLLLSRYEELVEPRRDRHERFPASASLAAREGFLERPLLDEYVEILWAAMRRLWPGLERPPRSGGVRYTCDVDHPYEGSSRQVGLLLRGAAGDLAVRRSPRRLVRRVANALRARRGDYSRDPHNTFDWLMDSCEARGLQASFYFIADHSGGAIDGCYELDEPYLQQVLRRIHDRGHEIGLHGSYNTFRDGEQLAHERWLLARACRAAGVDQPIAGVRQHYLRWDSAVTPALMQAAGFAYDTTGSFADHAGFRYGTGRSFPMWDWSEGRALRLRQRPLVVMECSVIARQYMNLGHGEAALQTMRRLKERCLRFGGDFTLLWHNSDFGDPRDRQMLSALLSS